VIWKIFFLFVFFFSFHNNPIHPQQHHMQVCLDAADVKLAETIGTQRYRVSTDLGLATRKYSKNDGDEAVNIIGTLGELAVLKHSHLCKDMFMDTTPTGGANDRFDAVFPDGKTCDVKTTKSDRCVLKIPARKILTPLPDVYVFVRLVNYIPQTSATLIINGGIPAQHVMRIENLQKSATGLFFNFPYPLWSIDAFTKGPAVQQPQPTLPTQPPTGLAEADFVRVVMGRETLSVPDAFVRRQLLDAYECATSSATVEKKPPSIFRHLDINFCLPYFVSEGTDECECIVHPSLDACHQTTRVYLQTLMGLTEIYKTMVVSLDLGACTLVVDTIAFDRSYFTDVLLAGVTHIQNASVAAHRDNSGHSDSGKVQVG
jgi:hypothetical protein